MMDLKVLKKNIGVGINMKDRKQIIAEQESIGNVEITMNKWFELESLDLESSRINYEKGILYFAPREVVYPEEKIGCGKLIGDNTIGFICGKHKTIKGNIMLCPSCQKKQDNHTRQQDVRKNDLGETNPHLSLSAEHIPAEDIPSSKIFEDEILKEVMQDKINMELFTLDQNTIIQEVIRKTIKLTKEKMGEDLKNE
jgi:hypothetical protein